MPHRRKRSNHSEELISSLVIILGLVCAATYFGLPDDSRQPFLVVSVALLLCALVAIVTYGLWKRDKERKKLRAMDMAGISTMDGLMFEKYLAELLRSRGYSGIVLSERFDLGVDIIAVKDAVRWGIQAKRYSGTVKADAVRQVVAGLTAYKCQRAMVITNSHFSRPAKKIAESNNCVLVDGDQLSEWIVQAG